MKPSNVAWRSSTIFVLVALIEVHVHELGHAVAALIVGARPVILYTSAVNTEVSAAWQGAIVTVAGPVVSLVFAALGLLAWRLLANAGPMARLAAAWATFHGYVGSVGYLVLTPFSTNDLGGLATYLNLPPIARWGAFAAGIVAMMQISKVLIPALARIAPIDVADADARSLYMRNAVLIPWIALVGIGLIVNFPPANWATLYFSPYLYCGIPLISTFIDSRKYADLKSDPRPWGDSVPWMGIAAVVALAVVDRLLFHPGITLSR